MAIDAFLSYHDRDGSGARDIGIKLSTQGLTTYWRQGDATLAGDELTTARCVVVLWSEHSARSPIVRRQAEYALEHSRLVSVWLDDTVIGPPFDQQTKIVLSYPFDQPSPAFAELVTAVERAIQESIAEEILPLVKPAAPHEACANRSLGTTKRRPRPFSKVFVCYRHEDSQDAAARLHEQLSAHFGDDHIFLDVASAPLGTDYVTHVTAQLAGCNAVIVMIGVHWLSVTDNQGRRRLERDDDLVRTEIAIALQREIPVIPVLVQDAKMPHKDDLPESIRPLARRSGINLSGGSWRSGQERLIQELERVIVE